MARLGSCLFTQRPSRMGIAAFFAAKIFHYPIWRDSLCVSPQHNVGLATVQDNNEEDLWSMSMRNLFL